MSPEQQMPEARAVASKSIEVRVEGEIDPYLDAYQYAVDVRPHYNKNQLAHEINDVFLGQIVTGAAAGDFIPHDDNERLRHSESYTGSARDIVSLLRLAMAAKVGKNPDWKSYLPEHPSVRESAIRFMEDRKLSGPYAAALIERFNQFEAERREQAEKAKMPEAIPDVDTQMDLADTALDAPGVAIQEPSEDDSPRVIDSGDVPLKRRASFQAVPESNVSVWAPPSERPKRPEHVDHTKLLIGDVLKIPFPKTDFATGKSIPGEYYLERFTVDGFETSNGVYYARLVTEAGIYELIPAEVLGSNKDSKGNEIDIEGQVRAYLGGVEMRKHLPLADGDPEVGIEPEPTAETATLNAEYIRKMMGAPEHVSVDSTVYVKGDDGKLHEAVFLGFYDNGDQSVSEEPKAYAAIRMMSTGEARGVLSSEMDYIKQQAAARTVEQLKLVYKPRPEYMSPRSRW